MISNLEVILRILLSTLSGGIIGMEREVSNRPAGLRTHILVSLGSTLIMLVSMYGFRDPETGLALGDPARLAAQVISGIGFLGAGTILITENRVKGLTTAASLWVSAGIGLAIGNGYYLGAMFTLFMVFITLRVLTIFERKVFSSEYRTLEVTAIERGDLIGEIISLLGKNNIAVRETKIINVDESNDGKDKILTISLKVRLPSKIKMDMVFHDLRQIPGMLEAFLEEDR